MTTEAHHLLAARALADVATIANAFTILRDYARADRRPLSEIADAVVRRQLTLPR